MHSQRNNDVTDNFEKLLFIINASQHVVESPTKLFTAFSTSFFRTVVHCFVFYFCHHIFIYRLWKSVDLTFTFRFFRLQRSFTAQQTLIWLQLSPQLYVSEFDLTWLCGSNYQRPIVPNKFITLYNFVALIFSTPVNPAWAGGNSESKLFDVLATFRAFADSFARRAEIYLSDETIRTDCARDQDVIPANFTHDWKLILMEMNFFLMLYVIYSWWMPKLVIFVF